MNSVGLSFNPLFPLPVILCMLIPAFSFFIYKEFQRNQKYLWLRLIALTLILISILGLTLKPSYRKNKLNGAILLTRNFDFLKVDSLVKIHPELKIIRAKQADSFDKAEVIKAWSNLADVNVEFVVGEGLPDAALEIVRNDYFQFIPGKDPVGVTSVKLPDEIFIDRQYAVEGTVNLSGKTKLKLIGPGGNEDSVKLNKGRSNFRLTFKSKISGLFIYHLRIEDSLNTTSLRVPIKVLPERKLRILFLQKSPDAEIRFLKNYLSEKGHAVTLRQQTSKNIFNYEYANGSSPQINFPGKESLNAFDLIFLDEKTFLEMSSSEKKSLKEFVRKGLGVIFMEPHLNEKSYHDFFALEVRSVESDTVHVKLNGGNELILRALPSEILEQERVISVLKNSSRVFSGYIFSGYGKIGFQLLEETYGLKLRGLDNDYASLWSSLIERVARNENNARIKLNEPFPYYEDDPLNVEVISEKAPVLFSDSSQVAMVEDVAVDGYWKGKAWAGISGWHVFRAKVDSSTLDYFVSDSSEWHSARAKNRLHKNLIASKARENNAVPIFLIDSFVPSIFFYLIFLLCSGFLWLAPKI